MDKELLVSKLHKIFSEQNKDVVKYAQAWLARDTFGGLYYSPFYILNVKVEHTVESRFLEIGIIFDFVMNGLTKDEFAKISVVHVCYVDDDESPSSSDIEVFSLQGLKAA